MTFKAVLFDLDGTLAYTIEDLADAMNWTLAQYGLPTHAVEDYLLMVGAGAEVLVSRALPPGRQELLADALPRMRARYGQHMCDKTRLYDGIDELLDALAERGLRLAILSNKPHEAVVPMVEHFFSRWTFAEVRGVGPDGIKKPDPTHAAALAERLGIPPAEFLYLGDTAIDVETALAAGMRPVGALWGFRDAEELAAAGCADLIEHPLRMLDLL